MQIESFKAYEWKELHEVTQYKDGGIFKTKNTGKHIHSSQRVPKNHVAVAISTKLTIEPYVTINPL